MIRIATPADFEDILELYKAGLEELGFKYKEDLLKIKIVNSYKLAPCFLVVMNDKICGMAGFTVVTTSHDGVASLADYMFYIKPEHRNIKTLDALMKTIKEFAMTHGLPVRLDFFISKSLKSHKRLLERYGFKVSALLGVYNG